MINYMPGFIPTKFIVFGCGGTGSRLVPSLAQFIASTGWVEKPEIFLNDFDVVEDKNLKRQNFVARDVNKNKAEVLAARYSVAYGISISACADRLTPESVVNHTHPMMNRIMDLGFTNTIFIMCVDSPAARREILLSLLTAQDLKKESLRLEGSTPVLQPINNVLLIDTGNENDFGQVVVSNLVHHEESYFAKKDLEGVPNNLPFDTIIPHIPIDWGYYLGMQATEAPSCADLDQTMAINAQMAVNAFGIIQNIMYRKHLPFHRLDISLAHGSIPQYITPAHLRNLMNVEALAAFKNSVDPTVKALADNLVEKIAKYKTEMVSEEIRDKYDEFSAKMDAHNAKQAAKEKAIREEIENKALEELKNHLRDELRTEVEKEVLAKLKETRAEVKAPLEATATEPTSAPVVEKAVPTEAEKLAAIERVKDELKKAPAEKKPRKGKAATPVTVASDEEKKAAIEAAIQKLTGGAAASVSPDKGRDEGVESVDDTLPVEG